MPDEYGLDESLLGLQAEWLYPAIGRVVCVCALLENRAQVLAEALAGQPQDALTMMRITELERIAVQAASRIDASPSVTEPIGPDAAEFYGECRRLLERRNTIVRALWPAQPGQEQFGWRPSRDGSGRTRVTHDNTRELMVELIERVGALILGWAQLFNQAGAARQAGQPVIAKVGADLDGFEWTPLGCAPLEVLDLDRSSPTR